MLVVYYLFHIFGTPCPNKYYGSRYAQMITYLQEKYKRIYLAPHLVDDFGPKALRLYGILDAPTAVEPGQYHPLLKFCWGRIILDEAHGIKNPRTVVSKACCMLRAESRWCVTGTPIQNSLSDVYGLLKFLRHEPWCEPAFWRSSIADAISSGVSTVARSSSGIVNEKGGTNESSPRELAAGASAAFGRVRRVLAPIMLRRTKNTLAEDGTPILTLPPIDFSIVHVTLSPPERQFYNARK